MVCMAKLPWSDNKDINILPPCRLCSEEAISVSGGKYCLDCYRELLTNIILERYPVTGIDVVKKLYKKTSPDRRDDVRRQYGD